MTEDQAYESLRRDMAKCCHRCLGRNEPHTTCHPSHQGDHAEPWIIEGLQCVGMGELSDKGFRQFGVKLDDSVPYTILAVPPSQELKDAVASLLTQCLNA